MQRSIQLLSGTGEIVAGLLCSMSARHLEDFETIWKGILRATEQPDSYWSWDYKLRQSNQDARYEAYSVEVDGLTQGMMFFETQWHRSQLPQRSPLIYTAPTFSADLYRGISGSTLESTATRRPALFKRSRANIAAVCTATQHGVGV